MIGQREAIAVGLRPQPGGRRPAPGRLALVQAFINTHYDLIEEPGAELLASAESLVRWMRRAGLLAGAAAATGADLERALAVREGLRALARDQTRRLDELARAAHGAALEVRVAVGGELGFVPAPGSGVAGALGVLLAIAAVARADGSWSRLKVCPGAHCGWAFYDGSRNRSGRWCSMAVCGGRAKARTHYHRTRVSEV